jgi:hypothetical protein
MQEKYLLFTLRRAAMKDGIATRPLLLQVFALLEGFKLLVFVRRLLPLVAKPT